MGRLILHIGTHKTGTTSIQRGLSRNRERLKEAGIWYPGYDLIGTKSHYAHLGIVNAFSGSHNDLTRDDAINFFAEVSARVNDFDATILSAEPFFRHIGLGMDGQPQRIPGVAENYWPKRNAYIQDVKDHFAVDEIEIALVVRRQVDYGQSLYQEHIKTSSYNGDFETFRSDFWQRFDYLRQARAWQNVFGKVRVIRFEDLVGGAGVLENFGAAIDLDLTNLSPTPIANISFPPDMVVWKRLLNASAGNKGVRQKVGKMAEQDLRDLLESLPRRSLYRDIDDMKAFQNSFEDANELLKYEFLPEVLQGGPMFSQVYDDGLQFGDTLSPDFLMGVMAQLG
jgi:hypothetical protein